ncbi:hypothetical protein ACHAWF_006623 [Thalassiosira exigua]
MSMAMARETNDDPDRAAPGDDRRGGGPGREVRDGEERIPAARDPGAASGGTNDDPDDVDDGGSGRGGDAENDGRSQCDGVDGEGGGDDEGDDEGDDGQDLLFSCQCDSARTVATLLSCLRRVVTAGASPSSRGPLLGGGGGHRMGTQSSSAAASALAASGETPGRIQHATVYAGPGGLTFHVSHGMARQSQCSVDLPRGLFREYFVGEEEVWLEEDEGDDDNDEPSQEGGGRKEIVQGGEFGVNLTTVLECFSVLSKNRDAMTKTVAGGSSGGPGGEYASLSRVPLCMSYDRGTATFHLEFLEGGDAASSGGGCLVTCEVPGVAVADDVDEGPVDVAGGVRGGAGLAAAFRSSPLASRAILRSDALREAVTELYDVPGASIVTVSLTAKGLELGAAGPRGEAWVDVPYSRGQRGGMYVGLECYDREETGIALSPDDKNAARSYPLGAFLSGMRGLDIGVETCVSVNRRGMMAIQHQIARDGWYEASEDGGKGKVRPSFVDFIMTCMEDDEEEDGAQSDAGATLRSESRVHSAGRRQLDRGLQDITNNEGVEDVENGGRKTREAATARSRAKSPIESAMEEREGSSEVDERGGRRLTGNSRKQRRHVSDDANILGDFGGDNNGVDFGENDGHEHQNVGSDHKDAEDESTKRPSSDHSATRILNELEVDQDNPSPHQGGTGRKNALEDIRRRRREQRLRRQSAEGQCENFDGPAYDDSGEEDVGENRRNGRKRRSGSNEGTRKGARRAANGGGGEINSDASNRDGESRSKRHSNPAQGSQSQLSRSDDEDDGDDSEHEDSLDVTAEIPQLFSKRSSLSTSRHGKNSRGSQRGTSHSNDGGGRGGHTSEEDGAEQEPRMMYGDTKLEFTQDGYGSDDSF